MVQNAANGLVNLDRHAVNEIAVHLVDGVEQRLVRFTVHELLVNLAICGVFGSTRMFLAKRTPFAHCKGLQFNDTLTVTVDVQCVVV